MSTETFPRRQARTRRFTLGAPRRFRVAADGRHVTFIRSDGPEDPVHSLWLLDVASGKERRLIDPRLLDAGDGPVSPAEQARRERTRELGEGVVTYTADRLLRRVAATVNGALVIVDVDDDTVQRPELPGSVFLPAMDPTGRVVACVVDRAVHLVDTTSPARVLVSPAGPLQSWGMAEFIAAEELDRTEAVWWSPDGDRVVLEYVDESPVDVWHIANPTEPWRPPRTARYPAAGSRNADWRLAVFGLDGGRVDVDIDRDRWEYLARVAWNDHGPPLATVLTRDQRTLGVLAVDPSSGATDEIHRADDDCWVDAVAGLPRWFAGRLLTGEGTGRGRRLVVDGEVLSPTGMEVSAVVDVDGDGVLATAWLDDPTQLHVVRCDWSGRVDVMTAAAGGVHSAVAGGGTTVIQSQGLDHDGTSARVRAGAVDVAVPSHAAELGFTPNVRLVTLADRRLRCALVLPRDDRPGPLPVLLDPYGGPHFQRVVSSRAAYATSQWFADLGMAVLVVDGRGTPGRGPQWERAVQGDLASPALEDQVDALVAAAAVEPRLDLTRVGIRGWSFGGYLAALAVLARPDVFHVAIAGAPVTDWRLYDTAYTERYLGRPDEHPEHYERGDLIPLASQLVNPLLLIHGLSDDNVYAAHSIKLSEALFHAGRPHTLLLLPETSHMTPDEVVAENLLRIQADFLDQALRFREPGG